MDGCVNDFNDDDRMIKITRSDDGSAVVLERARVIKLLGSWGYILENIAKSREEIYELYIRRLRKMIDGDPANDTQQDPVNEKFDYVCQKTFKSLLEFDLNQIMNDDEL